MKASEVQRLVRIDGNVRPTIGCVYHIQASELHWWPMATVPMTLCGLPGPISGYAKPGETGLFEEYGASTCLDCLERLSDG